MVLFNQCQNHYQYILADKLPMLSSWSRNGIILQISIIIPLLIDTWTFDLPLFSDLSTVPSKLKIKLIIFFHFLLLRIFSFPTRFILNNSVNLLDRPDIKIEFGGIKGEEGGGKRGWAKEKKKKWREKKRLGGKEEVREGGRE